MYDTGGLRRTHLRGHRNILKRLLIHASGFNLGILMRQACGRGTPRGLQGDRSEASVLDIALAMFGARRWAMINAVLAPDHVLLRESRAHSALAMA